jgi:hypothetical protein
MSDAKDMMNLVFMLLGIGFIGFSHLFLLSIQRKWRHDQRAMNPRMNDGNIQVLLPSGHQMKTPCQWLPSI